MKKLCTRVAAALLGLAQAALGSPLYVSVGSFLVNPGETFVVAINIDHAVDLTAWQFDLQFDASVLSANFVTEGPFVSAFGTTLVGPGAIDNSIGLISLVTDSYLDIAAMLTAMPRMLPASTPPPSSTPPVWMPTRTLKPM